MASIFLWLQVRPESGFLIRGADCETLGDFEEIYGSPDEGNEHIDQWHAIVTCFFIDTVCRPHPLSIASHL